MSHIAYVRKSSRGLVKISFDIFTLLFFNQNMLRMAGHLLYKHAFDL